MPNIPTFHTALRCIKLWAQRRALYNNAMGYVGGVACAILVARICQLYPNAAASKIISRFFAIYFSWQWPQPILLKPLEDFQLNMKVWNPRIHLADRYHRMPIITPAYPSMCSTHNVSSSTHRIMTLEFDRGRQLMDKIESGALSWHDLLGRTDFFYRYKQYIQIVGIASEEGHAQAWHGFLESKIRLFVSKLEQLMYIVGAPPFPEAFHSTLATCADEEALLATLKYTPPSDPVSSTSEAPDTATVAARSLILDDAVPLSDTLGTPGTPGGTPPPETTTLPPPTEHKTYRVATFYIGLEIQPRTGTCAHALMHHVPHTRASWSPCSRRSGHAQAQLGRAGDRVQAPCPGVGQVH